MIVGSLSDYPEWLSRKLFTGNFGAVCLAYRFPAELHYDNNVYLVHTEKELVRVLATMQAIYTYYGIKNVSTTVRNKPEWTSKQFSVLVDQTMTFEQEAEPQNCRMRFYVERRALRPAIHRVDVEHMPFGSEIVKQRAVRSLQVELSLVEP